MQMTECQHVESTCFQRNYTTNLSDSNRNYDYDDDINHDDDQDDDDDDHHHDDDDDGKPAYVHYIRYAINI